MSKRTEHVYTVPVPPWAAPVDLRQVLPQHLTPEVQAIKRQVAELAGPQILDKNGAPWRPRLSATQFDWYTSCPRKWGWAYIAKIKTPPNKWAALGKAVHDVLERWLKYGTPPDRNTEAGQIALPGIKHLPSPGQCGVEGRWTWDLPEEPFDLVGVIDWDDLENGLPRVGDHKTTGDFKWVKTPETLKEDIQATIYGKRTLHKTGAREVLGRWTYFKTRKPYSSCVVDFRSSIDEIDASFAPILEAGRAMAGWHRCKAKAEDLPTNAKACDAYGGCPFRDKCNLSSAERLVSLMSQESLKEKLARKKAELAAAKAAGASAAVAQTAPPAPPQPAQAPVPVAAQPQAAINPPEGQGGSRAMPTSTRTTGAAPGATLKEKMAARRRAALSQAPTVPAADSVPLPASSAAPAPVASAAAVAEPSAAPVAQTQPQGPAFSPPPPPAPAPVATQAAPPSLPGPAVNVPAHVEAELAGMAQAPVEAPPTNGDLPIKVLLVDCAPLQGDILSVINLSTLMHRLAEPAELGELIDGLKLPDNAAVTMSMRTPEGQLAFDALADRSELVIRGF